VRTPNRIALVAIHRSTRVCFLLVATLTSAELASGEAATQDHALTLHAGKESVVRFFFQPPDGEYFHVALLFRVVKKDDPRWNTSALSDVGRTAYVSLSEMQRLMTKLTHLSSQWDESANVEGLETYKTIHSYGYGMGVKVLSTKGTAKATIAPDKICETLAPLDSALLTPRALWEFQRFRLQYRCPVLGYRPDAYSEFP
jgi:hypothetical protein